MGVALLILLLCATTLTSFKKPEVGVYAYFLMSIMAPQFIWPWVFEGIPAFTIVAGSTIAAAGLSFVFGKVDLSVYKHRQNVLLIILFICFNLSDMFSPFASYKALTSSELVIGIFNTIILMYFISLPFLAKERHLEIMMICFIGMVMYYIFWSNDAYFNFDPSRFGYGGRLYGPLRSPYRDQNVFATLFVVGMPFLLFGVFYFKSLIVRGMLGFFFVFSLHSIILTGSRGALVGASIVVIFSYFLIKSRAMGVFLLVGFISAIIYQGGQLMDRTTDTIEAAQEEQDKPIDPRVQSWQVGFELIKSYPVLGVGVQRFQQATRVHFPERNPYVAHNTFLNFAANTGLLSGLIFLYFYYMHYRNFRYASKNGVDKYPFLEFCNKVFFVSLSGFYVCSLFLDLIIFEAFYFLLMLNLVKDYLVRKRFEESDTPPDDEFVINKNGMRVHAKRLQEG